jgi:hypothetical protein
MWLEAAGGRSAISKQAPVTLIAECALLRKKRTAELTNRMPSLLRSSPWPRDREPRCARRSDDTAVRNPGRRETRRNRQRRQRRVSLTGGAAIGKVFCRMVASHCCQAPAVDPTSGSLCLCFPTVERTCSTSLCGTIAAQHGRGDQGWRSRTWPKVGMAGAAPTRS